MSRPKYKVLRDYRPWKVKRQEALEKIFILYRPNIEALRNAGVLPIIVFKELGLLRPIE